MSTVLAATVGTAAAGHTQLFIFTPTELPGSHAPRTSLRYDVHPGAIINDSVILANPTKQVESFRIWAADGYNTTSQGALALRPYTYPKVDVGAWTTLPVGNAIYGVNPGTQITLHFSIKVPLDATPGSDHVGGLVALDVTPPPSVSGGVGNGAAKFTIHPGIGVPIFVHVIGPSRPGAAVTNVRDITSVPMFAFIDGSSYSYIAYTLLNTGNSILTGTVTVSVKDVFGSVVKQFPATGVSNFLPGQSFNIVEPEWKPLPIAGPEQVTVSFAPAGLAAVSGHLTIWVIPWFLIWVIAGLILLMLAWYIFRGKKRRRELDSELALGGGSASSASSSPAVPVG